MQDCHILQPSKEYSLQVLVRDNNIDQALRVLKKKMQREGVFREMKQRRSYEKPSERKTRERSEAIRRARKLARTRARPRRVADGLPIVASRSFLVDVHLIAKPSE